MTSSVQPSVSVTMPVYNGERYLVATVESIMGQTVTDLQFIVVNDGSTVLPLILSCHQGLLIRIANYRSNLGVARFLNNAIDIARSRYIAPQEERPRKNQSAIAATSPNWKVSTSDTEFR